jgi:glycosyltransferase involved in cell wall biosynthesis
MLFFIPTLGVGGAERHTVDLVERLRTRGFDCSIVVHTSISSPVITSTPGAAGATFLNARGLSEVGGWLRLWRLLRERRPDILVAINQTPLIAAAVERLAFATRAKLACIFHTTALQGFEAHQERYFRWAARLTDMMIYVGMRQASRWREAGVRARASVVIHNGIDFARFSIDPNARQATRARLGIGPEVYLIGMVAAFREEKNHVELVAALEGARAAGVAAHALMVGDGPTKPTTIAVAERLGLAAQITWIEEQSDVTPYMTACDAGVLCSAVETFPLSALEFLSLGVPMVSADNGGGSEIVHENINGMLYRPGDVDGLARAIVAMAEAPRRARLAARARSSVAGRDVNAMANAYADVFSKMAPRCARNVRCRGWRPAE